MSDEKMPDVGAAVTALNALFEEGKEYARRGTPGRCYDDAYAYACEWGVSCGLSLCHGLCVGTGGAVRGKTYGHAWGEVRADGVIWVVDRCGLVPAILYAEAGRITDVRRYSPDQARAMASETGHRGPWTARHAETVGPAPRKKAKRGLTPD